MAQLFQRVLFVRGKRAVEKENVAENGSTVDSRCGKSCRRLRENPSASRVLEGVSRRIGYRSPRVIRIGNRPRSSEIVSRRGSRCLSDRDASNYIVQNVAVNRVEFRHESVHKPAKRRTAECPESFEVPIADFVSGKDAIKNHRTLQFSIQEIRIPLPSISKAGVIRSERDIVLRSRSGNFRIDRLYFELSASCVIRRNYEIPLSCRLCRWCYYLVNARTVVRVEFYR